MRHIEEHILEMYILDPGSVGDKAAEIEAHIGGCEGCRSLLDEIAGFHADLREELRRPPLSESKRGKAMIRKPGLPQPFFDDTPIPYIPTTRIEKFRYMVRRHPIVSGATSFVSMAALAAATWVLSNEPPNPNFVRFNQRIGSIEVCDTMGNGLWSLPSTDITNNDELTIEIARNRTLIDDLDHDGRNEVITTLGIDSNRDTPRPVRMYSASGKVLMEQSFNFDIAYLNRMYGSKYHAGSIATGDFDGDGEDEIIVAAQNIDRSPACIVRLTHDGQELGRYWHFGTIPKIQVLDLNADGRMELLMVGSNDTRDTAIHHEFAFLAVLDPSKIVGESRTTTASGFGFKESDAELYYLQFPFTELHEPNHWNMTVDVLSVIGPRLLGITCTTGGVESSKMPTFHYYLDFDLHVNEVKSNSRTDQFFANRRAAGESSIVVDAQYLERLKQEVLYWDGREWRKEVVRVGKPKNGA